jgi:DNA polymerase-3 subunit epsilon
MASGFVALDVETANADRASICQVGLAFFDGPSVTREWKTLIDPQDFFDPLNVSIHGIDEAAVEGAPTFGVVATELNAMMAGHLVVTHTAFDRVAITRASEKVGAQIPPCTWLDSSRVARRAWSEVAQRGYGLGPLCERIGYSYRAHDALEDAKAAGMVLLAAMASSSLDPWAWVSELAKPQGSSRISADGNPEGPLFGEVVVFTGALTIPRANATAMAARAGCEVATSVGKKTTMLVIGQQDARRLNGHDKSSKHAKAEQLIADGQPITLLTEDDFVGLLDCMGA